MSIGDDFVEWLNANPIAIRAEKRVAMQVKRPEAFSAMSDEECTDCGTTEGGHAWTYVDEKGLSRLVCKDCYDLWLNEEEQWCEDISETDPDADAAADMLDSIRKAITKVRTQSPYEPQGVVLHPDDWEDILLAKGSPVKRDASMTPAADGSFGTLWGIPVIEDDSIPPGQVVMVGPPVPPRPGPRIWERGI